MFGTVSHAAGGNQRAGILAVGSFFVIGLLLLSRVKQGGPRSPEAGQEPHI